MPRSSGLVAVVAAVVLCCPAGALAAGPPNDAFADAINVGAPPGAWSASTAGATTEPGEPDHRGEPGTHSVWYALTPAHSGLVTVSTCDPRTPYKTYIDVYTGDRVDALTEVASNFPDVDA